MKDKIHSGRFLIGIALLMVCGFVATSLISFYTSRKTLRTQIINNELPLTSDNIYSEIQRDLLPAVFISSSMANDSFLRNWVINGEKNVNEITQFLYETQKRYNTFTSFFVSERTKIYYQSKGILKRVAADNPLDDWYFRVRKMKAQHEMNVDPDMANDNAMTIFANQKVYDFKGNYIGATGVGLTIHAVKKLIRDYHEKYNRTICFTDMKGKVILSSSENLFHGNVSSIDGISALTGDIIKKGSYSGQFEMNGTPHYINTRYIPELNWVLLVVQSEAGLVKNIYRTLLINLGLCVIITILVIIMVSIVVKLFQKRLTNLISEELELKHENHEQRRQIDRQHYELERQNQHLTQINSSNNKLFSIIAHDLRAPLGNISTLANMAADDLEVQSNTKKLQERLIAIKTLATSGSNMLENLFDWARSQMSEMTCIPIKFNLRTLLLENMVEADIQAKKKDQQLILNCDESLEAVADRNMIMTVVRNLISNAIKFTENGGKITVKTETSPDGMITVCIEDSGIGLTSERLTSIFDFAQNKSTSGTDGERGTGLGLSLCSEFVNMNGGKIWVESIQGEGSKFFFSLKQY